MELKLDSASRRRSVRSRTAMLGGMRLLARKMMRKIAAAPLSLVEDEMGAEILERLSENMVATAAITDGTLLFHAPSPLLQWRAKTALTKEPDMVRWLDDLGPDAVLWDIGANVGVFSLYAARRNGCRVLAFEPAAANFHVLARNITLNELTDRVSAYCVALAGKTGLGVLNLDSTAMGAALSQFGIAGDRSRYMGENISAQSMLGFTIDRFIELFDPPFPTHVKIDVDGLELAIVEGAVGTLRDPRLRSVMLELSLSNSEERNAGMRLMEAAGFRFVAHGEAQSSNNESAANHLFAR